MQNRRQFFRNMAGLVCVACGMRHAFAQPWQRREVSVGGRRIKTIDMHAHCAVPEVLDLVKGTPMQRAVERQLEGRLAGPPLPGRLADMNADGIDMQVLTINPFWYAAERDLVRRIIDLQNVRLKAVCAEAPDRLMAFATVSLQFPELAAEQLEHGVKDLGLAGAAIGGSVEGEEIASKKYDPFWAKAEALQCPIFIHPQTDAKGVRVRTEGSGALSNVIGNPLETTIALSHLIFEGTLDRYPNLKIIAAHGGGYLPSYAARMDHGCDVFPEQCKGPKLKKKPSEYLKQLYFDTIVFTPEALRHLVAEQGASQIVIGTDYAVPWVKGPVDLVLNTPELTDADRIAILGGNAAKLLNLPA